jgi:hypothetical protein
MSYLCIAVKEVNNNEKSSNMATIETINKALEVLKNHDWWWMMADYTHPAIDNARGSMRYYVELVATIKDAVVRNAMRELWKATYENVHNNMWSKDEEANKVYEAKKTELMAIILPLENSQQMAA